MESTMQEIPLLISRIVEYGRSAHRNVAISTYFNAEPEVTTFGELGNRAAALAHALSDVFDVKVGDRVATLMSNCAEHLETMLATMSMGAIFHPLNRYLMGAQIQHIIAHAQDKVIVCDPTYAELLIPLLDTCPTVEGVIVLDAAGIDSDAARPLADVSALAREHVTRPMTILGYEAVLDGRPSDYDWPIFDETTAAAVCYSTGTEGQPKAVVYSHRSLWLHSMSLQSTDSFSVRNGTTFLCCVPIYHVLSWGVPLTAFMVGAPMVFVGRTATPAHLAHVIADAMPRQAHGAPTVWTGLMVHYNTHPPEKMSLQEIYAGGSQVSPAIIASWEERFGVDVIHAWGMTETGPVGSVAHPPAGVAGEARQRYRDSQGRFPVGIEYRIVDDNGQVLPNHDRNAGELQVRGNTVTGSYYNPDNSADGGHAEGEHAGGKHAEGTQPEAKHAEGTQPETTHTEGAQPETTHTEGTQPEGARPEAAHAGGKHAPSMMSTSEAPTDERFTADGWLRTGDIGTVNKDGYLTIHDRKNDLIRSGGEWIYSAALENYLMEATEVIEAAVIGIPDERWGQRPLAVVNLTPETPQGRETAESLAEFISRQVPGWMVPENWTFVDSIFKTSVDKFDKKDLREAYRRGSFDVITLPKA
ncbi:AMP-binding protein [Corynebacterium sp. HMSC28B08]|uniref:AMP-binding protein n=1 Tax=Corynebacterium sp. HMSC28B08 TaxID=1581066 RepID=UPI0008AF44B4|nr:long-chain fatty acid--CoA ligase [Corynebacterium sp. HMSC28B08]